jgi:hypothetical protein
MQPTGNKSAPQNQRHLLRKRSIKRQAEQPTNLRHLLGKISKQPKATASLEKATKQQTMTTGVIISSKATKMAERAITKREQSGVICDEGDGGSLSLLTAASDRLTKQ